MSNLREKNIRHFQVSKKTCFPERASVNAEKLIILHTILQAMRREVTKNGKNRKRCMQVQLIGTS
jgi:hypothetical protein